MSTNKLNSVDKHVTSTENQRRMGKILVYITSITPELTEKCQKVSKILSNLKIPHVTINIKNNIKTMNDIITRISRDNPKRANDLPIGSFSLPQIFNLEFDKYCGDCFDIVKIKQKEQLGLFKNERGREGERDRSGENEIRKFLLLPIKPVRSKNKSGDSVKVFKSTMKVKVGSDQPEPQKSQPKPEPKPKTIITKPKPPSKPHIPGPFQTKSPEIEIKPKTSVRPKIKRSQSIASRFKEVVDQPPPITLQRKTVSSADKFSFKRFPSSVELRRKNTSSNVDMTRLIPREPEMPKTAIIPRKTYELPPMPNTPKPKVFGLSRALMLYAKDEKRRMANRIGNF